MECPVRWVISPFVVYSGHRILKAVVLGSHSVNPGDLPRPRQRCFRLTRPKLHCDLGSLHSHPFDDFGGRCQSLHNGARDVLNVRVDCHFVVQFGIERS